MKDTPGSEECDPQQGVRGDFAATRWTLVVSAARGADTPRATAALAELCRVYWFPIYVFLRRRGHDVHDAEDLAQEFFARLLAPGFLASVDPKKGRFRSFLLGAMKHFLSDQWDRATAQKRGGGKAVIPLDALDAEDRYRLTPTADLTPERMFERQWVMALLEQVLARLQCEMDAAGKTEVFAVLQPTLTAGKSADYATLAERLGMTPGAVKVAVHRLRRRYRELLTDEIAQTVANEEEIKDEIRYLFACL